MRFDHVALLGSVLPADYQWNQRREWGQARLVRTDRASDDLVVAVFCNALRGVGMTDVGTSGWSGFEDSGGVEHEISWYRGGHSAALSSSNLNNLTDFLATGRVSEVGPTRTGPSHGLALLSQLAPWLARLVFALAIGLIARWLWRAPQRQYRVALLATAATLLVIVLDVV